MRAVIHRATTRQGILFIILLGLLVLFAAGCEDGEVVSGPEDINGAEARLLFSTEVRYSRDETGRDSTLITLWCGDYLSDMANPFRWIEFDAPRMYPGDEAVTITRTYADLFSRLDTLTYQVEFHSGRVYADQLNGFNLPVIPEFAGDTLHVDSQLEFTIETLNHADNLLLQGRSSMGVLFSVTLDQPGDVSIPLPDFEADPCELRLWGMYKPQRDRLESVYPDTTLDTSLQYRFDRTILMIQDLDVD